MGKSNRTKAVNARRNDSGKKPTGNSNTGKNARNTSNPVRMTSRGSGRGNSQSSTRDTGNKAGNNQGTSMKAASKTSGIASVVNTISKITGRGSESRRENDKSKDGAVRNAKGDGFIPVVKPYEVKSKRPLSKDVVVDGVAYSIPIDRKGNVEFESLVYRYMEYMVKDADSRNIALDLGKTSRNRSRYHRRLKPEDVAEWWAHPNRSDIIGLDDENSPVFSTKGAKRKSSMTYQRRIAVIGQPEEREMTRKVLDASLNTEDMKKMSKDGCIYIFKKDGYEEFSNEKRNGSGCYNWNDDAIFIKSKDKPSAGTIAHETTHRLRYVDKDRTGVFNTSKLDEIDEVLSDDTHKTIDGMEREAYLRHLIATEEAATECETMIRMTPYGLHDDRKGYYRWITSEDRIKELKAEGRELLVGNSDPKGKGLTGKKAANAVEEKFRSTRISGYDNDSGRPAREYRKRKQK